MAGTRTREQQLAQLLTEIGLERGVGIEPLAGELATLALPAFVDASAFHSALLDAIEDRLRARLEEQIAGVRRLLVQPGTPSQSARIPESPAAPAPTPAPTIAPATTHAPTAAPTPASAPSTSLGWVDHGSTARDTATTTSAQPAGMPIAAPTPASTPSSDDGNELLDADLPSDATIYWSPGERRGQGQG